MSSISNKAFQHRYEMLERIGAGGVAEVFSARACGPHGFEKKVALKRILPEYAISAEFARSLIAEARKAATLNHSNIVSVFDCGQFGESLYVVMELVEGLDLGALLRLLDEDARQMSLDIAIFVALELLEGLDYAHQHGVIHGHLSPSNLLISRSGGVKLTDFGIAKAADGQEGEAAARELAGSWRYTSPEQTRGESPDARSDLFSAAAVLFELFAGRPLFDGSDAETIARQIRTTEIPRPSALRPEIPEPLDALLGAALARDPEARPERAGDLLRGLARISRTHSLHAGARDLERLVGALAPTTTEAGDPAAPPSSADLIDAIIRSELSLRRAVRAERQTQVTLGIEARRLSDEDTVPMRESDGTQLPDGERTSTITLVIPEVDRDGQSPPDDDERTPEFHPVSPAVAAGSESERPERIAGRPQSWWLLAAVALASAAAGAWLAMHWKNGGQTSHPEPTASRERDRPTAEPTPPAVTVETLAALADAAPADVRETVDASTAAPGASDAGVGAPEPDRPLPRKPRAKQRVGTIKLHVEPWAEVYLNGRKVGDAPNRRLELPIGTHRLRLVNPVLKRSGWVTVEVPSARTYRVTLP